MNKGNHVFIVRIDDRLIHGQVIVGWARALNLNKIIVANNKLLRDKLKLEMMKLAVPSDLSVEFLTLEKAVVSYKENKWKDHDCILIFESPKDVYYCISEGCKLDKINVGGLHINNQRKQVTPNLAFDGDDIYNLKKMLERNILLEGRALPGDEEYKIDKILTKKKK